MTWTYAYSPHIWPSFLTVLLLIALAVYSWRRRSVPGAIPFIAGCLLASLWAAGSAMEYAAVDVATKITWVKFQGALQLPATTALTCFILEYTWPGRWLTRRNLALLSIAPLLVLLLVLTDDFHHLAWRSLVLDGSVSPVRSSAAWFFTAYAYGLSLIEIYAFIWLYMHSPQHRWPVALVLIGNVGARAVYLLEAIDGIRSALPLDVFAIAFLFLMYAVALFGFHIFDPIPLARQTAIEQLHAGMLVLDPQGRVASLNPAAESILGVSVKQAKGQPVKAFLPAYPDRPLVETSDLEIEIDHLAGQETRDYILAISPLRDWRGLEAGRLLMLHDVTEQKQTQARIIAQQRALATLTERERLARELHDSLGQVLGYSSMQVDAAARLFRDGQGDSAARQLERLGSVVREAHADLREYILNLRTAPSLHQPLFMALQQYLVGYNTNYDIRTCLSIDPELREGGFSPETQLQVFRIIQEALSNARKHGRARHVDITFTRQDGRVCMIIEDDGLGFEPEKVAASSQQRFGLQFMQERAAQLGGSLRVQSSPGKGTRVVLIL